MRVFVNLSTLIGMLTLSFYPVSAQDLPDDILADQYFLEATEAIERGDTPVALKAFGEIEALDMTPPAEFLYIYGKLLVEKGAGLDEILKGESLLKQYVVNVGKESEHYKSTLKLLSVARERKAQAQEFEALRNRYGSLRFWDCEGCPEMVIVPAGVVLMGSTDSESDRDRNEGPVHRVTIAQPFAVGVYEVTFAQWDMCRRDGGCSHAPKDSGWGRGSRPVMNVSWHDAKEYVRWLSRKTGKGYRLLSEAEWEYVARAGTKTRYWWGDEVGHGQANCDGCGSQWDDDRTAPVGSFAANAFGLYDVHGNVWEWVEDCWHGGYAGAPSDGSAWTAGGNCEYRVLRGGSWYNGTTFLRFAHRYRYTAGYQNYNLGFRVTRILD